MVTLVGRHFWYDIRHLPFDRFPTIARWLFQTDAGLFVRIGAGAVIFATLALIDLHRRGSKATRWREYGVLVAGVLIALCYGAVNDQLTVTISREYFLYGKELAKVVGDPPKSEADLRWAAAKVGFKATWTVGLVFAVAVLLANNPSRKLPRLRNRTLVMLLPVIVGFAAVFAGVGGLLGFTGVMTGWQSDFRDMVAADLWHPRRYMAVWGIHLGGYVGGLVGTAAAVIWIVRLRYARRGVGNPDSPLAPPADVE